MIVDLFFSILVLIARGVAALLPNWEPVDFEALGDAMADFGTSSLWSLLAWLNWYVPLKEALLAGGAVLGLYVGVVLYKLLVNVLTKAHVLGGSGEG